MGGLIARLQSVDSGEEYWQLVSDKPPAELAVSPQVRRSLEQMFYFRANPSVRRVVTIATPHLGSRVSNGVTQWLGRRIIDLPDVVVEGMRQLAEGNSPQPQRSLLEITTSIDSLAPESPILPVLRRTPAAPGVKFHNIVALLPDTGLAGKVAGGSDGILTYESARLEQVDSELVVPADHFNVHRHPRTVLEMHRILLEQLAEIEQPELRRLPPPAGPPVALAR
jgi:hypothetical protein